MRKLRGLKACFDDHLGLSSRDFSGVRLVVFHGVSGSGKSTAIARLVQAHPEFQGQRCSYVTGPYIDWRQVTPSTELVVVDECTTLRDALGLAQLLSRGHRVLASSHLPLILSAGLGRIWPAIVLATDREPAKIERYLKVLGAHYSPDCVGAFCAQFGASYCSVDLVMDFDGSSDFDRAYDRFRRCCRVETKSATDSCR